MQGRHTGLTDIPLTRAGEREAALVPGTLDGWKFDAVYASPLVRASETARLAGFEPTIDRDLLEWDYGEYEGMRNDEIVDNEPGWSKWAGPIPGGEEVGDVAERADRFLGRLDDGLGDVLVFAHGHFLSIMIARWLDLDSAEGRRFPLATATVSVVSQKRSDRIIQQLNHRCGNHPAG
jgi:broad specificity phosphatase PhoE